MSIDVQSFMKRKGFRNQTELANQFGVSQSAISSWNAGVHGPTYETCVELIKAGMTIRELFGEEIDEIVKKEPNTVKPSQDEITQMVKTALRTLAQ